MISTPNSLFGSQVGRSLSVFTFGGHCVGLFRLDEGVLLQMFAISGCFEAPMLITFWIKRCSKGVLKSIKCSKQSTQVRFAFVFSHATEEILSLSTMVSGRK